MSRNNEKNPSLLEFLESLNKRLTALEQKVASAGEAKPIYEKVRLPTHDLEQNTKLMTGEGVTDVTNLPVCSVCHGLIEQTDHFFVCHHCAHVLCDNHAIMLNNRAHCEEDLRQHHIDLSRREYKALVCLANGIDDTDRIAEFTAMHSEEVEQTLAKLSTSNLVTSQRRLFGLLKEVKPTDEGLLAISVYRQFVYGRDEDMELFGKKLREFLVAESGFNV